MTSNPELELAYDYIAHTNRHLFLTGKAGTGKTTFLHRVRGEIKKRTAVVAPTGVAAINAKGVTIHSLFQLPFGVLTPERLRDELPRRRVSGNKLKLLRSLDLLIIDEISMVRADVLDAIDQVLQRARRDQRPFGGLQLLMIGDLHQLPPVVKDIDWEQMRTHYRTPYFFGALCLESARPAVVQLKKVYRQADEHFIKLLNRVRNNQMDGKVIAQLNSRHQPDFTPSPDDGYVTLSSHRATAKKINQERLDKLPTKSHEFRATIEGDFPASLYPNEVDQTFKVGAQVMFNKNDTGWPERLYYNGKIGTITQIEGPSIEVTCPGEEPIDVLPVIWENRKYELDPKTKTVEERVVGEYSQHPLRLAWAITIHKSQGLTFDKVIIDAEAAFAHGQVYVALSRCRTFEGIVLRTPLGERSIRTDSVVKDYSAQAEANQPDEQQLRQDKYAYQVDCLRELFNFSQLEFRLTRVGRLLLEGERSLEGQEISDWKEISALARQEIIDLGNKFLPRLEGYFRDQRLPAENTDLTKRLDSSADYFLPKLKQSLLPAVKEFTVVTDNQGVGESVEDARREVELEVFTKARLFQTVQTGFDPVKYVAAKADAELDFDRGRTASRSSSRKAAAKSAHPVLYGRLEAFRQKMSHLQDVKPTRILSAKSLQEIIQVLPTTKDSLLRVKGYGYKRFKDTGESLLAIVKLYVRENKLQGDQLQFASDDEPKRDTKEISLDAFRAGKTPAEIAADRDLTEGTIFSHLAHYLSLGDISANELIDQDRIDIIKPYLQVNPDQPLGETFRHFDERYGYHEFRIVRKMIEMEEE
ncbi:MAG: helix-turn-helix domain-containing protein [Bacteroidota bacterium]